MTTVMVCFSSVSRHTRFLRAVDGSQRRTLYLLHMQGKAKQGRDAGQDGAPLRVRDRFQGHQREHSSSRV